MKVGENRASGTKVNVVIDGDETFKGRKGISLVEAPGRHRGVLNT